jgi:hypothetical protein
MEKACTLATVGTMVNEKLDLGELKAELKGGCA